MSRIVQRKLSRFGPLGSLCRTFYKSTTGTLRHILALRALKNRRDVVAEQKRKKNHREEHVRD